MPSSGMKQKMGPLSRAAATLNRLASGAPKGRREDDADPTTRRKARDTYGSKLKAPPVSKPKYGAGQGSAAKMRKAALDKKIRDAGG